MEQNPLRILYGNGSALTNSKSVQRRARCKFITQTTMLKLIDIAKEKGATDRVKSYWNTFHCQNNIYSSDSKLYAPRCKNRFCTYCSGVRKAELINKYLPIFQTWKEPYFVTLTVKTVKAKELPSRIKDINRAFQKLKARYNKRYERGTGQKLMGLKSIECNFNPLKKWYNPHIHLILPNRQIAEQLINDWLEFWTDKYALRCSQDCRKIENGEKDLIEVIKYGAKLFTEPDGKKKRGKGKTAKIYARALDNIYAAMKGTRIIDHFGFTMPKKQKEATPSLLTIDYMHWQYDSKSRDWINNEHESTLTAFVPDHNLESILQNNIDTELE